MASELRIAPGDFFCETIDCTGSESFGTRDLCRENGWLNYDTLSGCSVATNRGALEIVDSIPAGAKNVTPSNTTLANYWPPNRGFGSDITSVRLEPGQVIDRFGGDAGKFFSPAGTPFELRALPGSPGNLSTFEVLRPFRVDSGLIAPAFGQPGTGVQLVSPFSAGDLIGAGFIKRVN